MGRWGDGERSRPVVVLKDHANIGHTQRLSLRDCSCRALHSEGIVVKDRIQIVQGSVS